MKIILQIAFLLFFLQSCGQNSNQNNTETISQSKEIIIPKGTTLQTRILPPRGYQRKSADKNSFDEYLRNLPLKPHNSEVLTYNGGIKPNYDAYVAVVNLPIGNKDLHQCADAVMRLRAEYLWNQKQYDKIHFNFTNGFRVDYSEWMKGKRIVVKGNATSWVQSKEPSNTYDDFWQYMEMIFNYAGTLSLSKELQPVTIENIQIGDVFIKGGSPGHAVIVVDVAVNPKTNKKIFLLAQSYMPAQEIQILENPNNKDLSPWYSTDFENQLQTPEWIFDQTQLKRFGE